MSSVSYQHTCVLNNHTAQSLTKSYETNSSLTSRFNTPSNDKIQTLYIVDNFGEKAIIIILCSHPCMDIRISRVETWLFGEGLDPRITKDVLQVKGGKLRGWRVEDLRGRSSLFGGS